MIKELCYPFESEYILKKRKRLRRELLADDDSFLEINIAILSGSTVGEMQNILELFLLNQGIKPTFMQGEYNRFYEEAVFEHKRLAEFKPDIVYIHTSVKNIEKYPSAKDDKAQVEQMAESEAAKYIQVYESIRENVKCPVIGNNFEHLPYRVMGNADSYMTNGKLHYINILNEKLYEYARNTSTFYVNDINYQSSYFGLNKWFDNSLYYLYKYPFAMEAIVYSASNIANIIKSVFGRNKKALVTDLDDTMWGGVIGEVGVEGIELGIDTARGMAFQDFQQYIKDISDLGISLSVCSKNNEDIAREGFTHTSSVLSIDDFISFKANWKQKDENIRQIAKEINIGEDSIVFLDDNPVERMIVGEGTAGVTAVDLTNPEEYVDIVDKLGLFEVTNISDDDKMRNKYYQDNIKREESARAFASYEEYLMSLDMTSYIMDFTKENLERITQLINKTNQFNLTTKRMTSEEVEECIGDKYIALSADLQDKFGDNGLISCFIGEINGDILDIVNWVMSCRVFKRNLECAIFDKLIERCKSKGITKIKGYFYKTKKNGYVSSLFEDLGFTPINVNDEYGEWEYVIPVIYDKKNTVIEVK